MTLRLGAALFNADHIRLGEEVRRVEAAGLDFVHLDVFDGHFVPDLGFSPHTIAALRPLTPLPFEVHLAANDPLRFVPALREAGVDRVLMHVESVPLVYEALFAIRERNMQVGLVVALGTPLSVLHPVLAFLDAVLVLSRVTGEGVRGASFNPLVLPRVAATRRAIDMAGVTVELEVAGGVNRNWVVSLAEAGARALGLGAGIYRVPDMAQEVAELRALVPRGV